MLASAKWNCAHADLIFVQFWMSAIKSFAYDNILTELNIEASVHMHNIGRNFRSGIFVETARNSIGTSLELSWKYIECKTTSVKLLLFTGSCTENMSISENALYFTQIEIEWKDKYFTCEYLNFPKYTK